MDTEQQIEKADYGENFKDLPADRIAELQSVLLACTQRDQFGRMIEIIRTTLRRKFWLGAQHEFWNAESQQFQVGPGGGNLGREDIAEEDLFDGDFNIYTQNGKIFIAVFSQNAASTRMEPDKAGEGDSVSAAEEAEKYVQVYEKYNPPKVSQQNVGRLLYTDGRVIAVTQLAEDEDHLGFDEDEKGELVPRSTELTTYHGVLETKCPLVEPFSKWPYCRVSRELDILTAKFDNPDFESKLQAGGRSVSPNDEIARMSRIAVTENVAQISADTLAHMVTEDVWWLRPSAFKDLPAEKQAFWIGGQTKQEDGTTTDQPGIFPQGCRVKFFGSVFCGAEAVRMSDELKCMHAMPGDGNARPSLSDAMVPIQMEYNDAIGMYSEMIHLCIPGVWINTGPEEIQAILEQEARYGRFHPFVKPDGQPLEDNFFPEPSIDVPASFPAWVENLQGPLSQFVTGNSPALFGQQMEDQKTAHGYEQARDQSLGLMALVWVPYLEFAAGIRGQAARCAAKREAKIAAVITDAKGKQQTLNVDTAAMRGGFLCTPVIDQNFPESWTEVSNKWMAMLQAAPTNPLIAKNLMLPDNLVAMRDAIGLKNFVIEGADSRDLQLAEWAKMQGGSGPVPDLQATQQRDQQKQQAASRAVATLAPSQEPPPLPQEPPIQASSVPIDPETDDHIVHALEMFRILNSPEGQKIKAVNELIWQDGKIHMLAHVAAAQVKGLMIPPPLGSAPPMLPPGKGTPPGSVGGPLAPPNAPAA